MNLYYSYATVDGCEFQLTRRFFDNINCTEFKRLHWNSTKKGIVSDELLKIHWYADGSFWDGDVLDSINIGFKPCVNSTINNNSCIQYDYSYSVLFSGNL